MSSRPPVFTWNEELHFGPPSEPINIQTFIDHARELHSRGLFPRVDFDSTDKPEREQCTPVSGWRDWQELSEDVKTSVKQDCDLGDLSSSLSTILSSPKHMHYLQSIHAEAITESGIALSQRKNKGKGRQTHAHDDPDLAELRNLVEHTPLRFWKLKPSAGPYVRGGHVSDQNALDAMQLKQHDPPQTDSSSPHALIMLTTYTRNTWYPFAFSRDSQHAFLSSNTLADVWSCIPCTLGHGGSMPKEVIEVDPDPNDFGHYTARVVGYEAGDHESDPDLAVMVVEGVAYSNSHDSGEYADKLLAHLELFRPPRPSPDAPPLPPAPYERFNSTTPPIKGPPMENVELRTLNLRINEPYWVLHRGSCEHWFVVDEIRLQHPKDPPSGYPVALQRTPTTRPLCRICTKVPATLSVINDVRLGESPSLVCMPCWECFGGPPQAKEGDTPADRVIVVPMVAET